MKLRSLLMLSVLPIVFLGTAAYMRRHAPAPAENIGGTLLLIPDSLAANDPAVQEWFDAAEEEGLHIAVIHDSEFLNPMRGMRFSESVIVPDQIHRICNDALVGALYSFAAAGGKLMIVYDACTYDLNGNFTKGESRLSELVGVSYGLYDEYKTECIQWSQVWGKREAMSALEIPPGKFVPAERDAHGSGFRAVSLVDAGQKAGSHPLLAKGWALTAGPFDAFILRRYEYGDVDYPSFRTEGKLNGTELLRSRAGVVAGYRQQGAGNVLFANIPLGYLESRTDGLLLHSFLHYFMVRMQRAPYLAAVPDGVGGLIFNWHIDGRSAMRYLQTLFAAGVFDDGPFSVHFTAGPDVDSIRDGKGLDIDHNPEAQKLIRDFEAHGDAIGSHGGWIHNVFGENLSDTNESTYVPYLQWNVQSLERASGRRMLEYSAPVGNHPEWVTGWLEQNGFNSYYFVGDSGMAPTRVYRDRTRDGKGIWAFPILHLGKYAALEEMGFDNVPDAEVKGWLDEIADFTASTRSARLVYTHPLAAVRYLTPLEAFLHHTRELKAEGDFRWYAMSSLADFLNRRLNVRWKLMASCGASAFGCANTGGNSLLVASIDAPESLEHLTWILPRGIYRDPKVTVGNADIRSDAENWLITAGNCRRLEVLFQNATPALQIAKR